MKSILKHAALAACLAAGFALPTSSFATPITYDIDVTVTSAPHAPGVNVNWFFGSLLDTFQGTFTADDTTAGAISNLDLVIGGINIASLVPIQVNSFNPGTLILSYHQGIPNTTGMDFGNPVGNGSPSNYAAAYENTGLSPPDQYSGYTQNWVGTYSITQAAVPEPASLALFAVGLAGFGVRRNRRA